MDGTKNFDLPRKFMGFRFGSERGAHYETERRGYTERTGYPGLGPKDAHYGRLVAADGYRWAMSAMSREACMQVRETLCGTYARLTALQHFLPVMHAVQDARLQHRKRRKVPHTCGGPCRRNHRASACGNCRGCGNNGQRGPKKGERDGTSGHGKTFG